MNAGPACATVSGVRPVEFFRRVAELLEKGAPFATARLLDVRGSAPQEPGAAMIVFPDQRIEGTIGGGRFEATVILDAAAALEKGEPRVEVREYALTQHELRMYCAGRVRVLVELHRSGPELLICGGGHVGQALGRLAAVSGLFHTTLVDDRAEFASRERHPTVDRLVLTDPTYREGFPALHGETYAVIVTRCHAVDKHLVKRLATEDVLPYLGLIGSRSKIASLFDELEAEGVPRAALARVRAPIGLPIGGKEPGAVAVSILAEVVQVLNGRRYASGVSTSSTTDGESTATSATSDACA